MSSNKFTILTFMLAAQKIAKIATTSTFMLVLLFCFVVQ